MEEWRTEAYNFKLALGCSFLTLWTLVAPAFCWTAGQVLSDQTSSSEQKHQDYTLGPGDVLKVTVVGSPEMTATYRVAETGDIMLPGLSHPIGAQGLTALELSNNIAEALKAAELIREPMVNVFVEQYHSHTVTILGAVAKPSVYALEKPTTLLEALSLAGGLLPTAGPTLNVARKGPPAGIGASLGTDVAELIGGSTQAIDLSKLVEGKDLSLNIELRAGDVVTVSTAPVVYVAGAVMRPGGFVLQDPKSDLTVLKALAMAEGLKAIASGKRSIIVRRSANGEGRQEIPIDVAKLMARKIPDQVLEPNDILFIPESTSKKSLHKLGDAAMGALNSLAIYSGYRVLAR